MNRAQSHFQEGKSLPKRGIVAYVQFTNPCFYPPLDHSSWILIKQGYETIFLGRYVTPKDMEYDEVAGRTLMLFRRRKNTESLGWYYLLFSIWVLYELIKLRPRVIYCSDPFSYPLGLFCWFFRCRVILHEHDSPQTPKKRTDRLFWRVRTLLAQRCFLAILPNHVRAQRFESQTRRKAIVVWNVPRVEEIQPIPRTKSGISLVYAGSITEGRMLMEVIQALAQATHQVHFHLMGYDPSENERNTQKFLSLAESLGVRTQVTFYGQLTRSKMFEACQGIDLGCAFMPGATSDTNMQNSFGASNKVFDYLAVGILPLINIKCETDQDLLTFDLALPCDAHDPHSIAQVLDAYVLNRDLYDGLRSRAREKLLAEWNYQHQFQPVLDAIQSC
jgi:glycosyltransferase involved in cell wall biosynthesis